MRFCYKAQVVGNYLQDSLLTIIFSLISVLQLNIYLFISSSQSENCGCEPLDATLFEQRVPSFSVLVILHKMQTQWLGLHWFVMRSDLAVFPLSFLQTWQPTIQAAGSPQERPADSEWLPNRPAFYTFWHWHYQSRNHARRRKTNNLSASHWLSHTRPTGKQRVNMF